MWLSEREKQWVNKWAGKWVGGRVSKHKWERQWVGEREWVRYGDVLSPKHVHTIHYSKYHCNLKLYRNCFSHDDWDKYSSFLYSLKQHSMKLLSCRHLCVIIIIVILHGIKQTTYSYCETTHVVSERSSGWVGGVREAVSEWVRDAMSEWQTVSEWVSKWVREAVNEWTMEMFLSYTYVRTIHFIRRSL